MNKQEIFSKVWDHFVVRRNPLSVNIEGDCMYRGPNGERCALGVLIPDELYHERMDAAGGMSASFLLRAHPSVAEHLGAQVTPLGCEMTDDMQFLHDLQVAHDHVVTHNARGAYSEHIEEELRLFALKHDLEVPA